MLLMNLWESVLSGSNFIDHKSSNEVARALPCYFTPHKGRHIIDAAFSLFVINF